MTLMLYTSVIWTPGGCLRAPLDWYIAAHIEFILYKYPIYDGLWGIRKLIWHPFDDSISLYDPDAANTGPKDPEKPS